MALEVSSEVPSLGKLLKHDWGVDKTVKDELWNLEAELSSMHNFLNDVSSMLPHRLESTVKIRAHQVRELSRAIETRLHSFMARIESTKDAFLPAMSKRKINREMASYIKETLIMIKEVSKRYGPYPCKSALESTSTFEVSTPMFAPDTRESNPVGLEGAITELTKKLSRSDHVSIVGIGGMGKTILARAAYDKMKGDFDCGAFVPIGQSSDIKKLLMYIFDGLHMKIYAHEPEQHQLTNQLQDFLVDKRCLFVIDDIWDKETCYMVEGLLKGSVGSKIITTTRNLTIAKGVGGNVYTMKPLCPDDSKRLLRAKAGAKSYDTDFDIVSDKFLLKCGGVPIALAVTGRLLVNHQRKEWHRVYDSIGFDGHRENAAFEHIWMVFADSYYALSYNIKKCFLYLSLFQEHQCIEKNMLIWRWVAEGLVPDGLFETGETYFNELLDRGMIQLVVSPGDVGQGGCQVHNLMLSLIRNLSSSENFSTVLELGMKLENTSQTGPIHRLAIHKSQNQYTSLEVGEVLSFYASMCPGSSLPPLQRFKRLRVIDLEACDLSVRDCKLKDLGKLKGLKYVGLVGTSIAELPKEIGGLELMQTLDVTATGIRELPPFVGELRKLRCLRAGKGTRMMGRIGGLMYLEQLWLHSTDKSPDFAAELRKLSEMRVLVIHFDEMDEGMQKVLVASLHKLKKLQVLRVCCDTETEEKGRLSSWEGSVPSPQLRELLFLRIILPRLMPWIHHLHVPKLSKLLLQVEVLKTHDLEILGQMPSLCSLSLHSEDNSLSYTAGSYEFKVLEHLNTNIELICGAGALPSIQELEVGTSSRTETDVGLRGNMPLLEKATYRLDCRGYGPEEVHKAEKALRRASRRHPNSPVLTIKRWNDDLCSSSFQGNSCNNSECESQVSTDSVESPPQDYSDDSVLSLLNSPDGAALLSEEAAKLTVDPLLSGGYDHIPQAGYLDCSSTHTATGERSHCEVMEPTSLTMILLQKITNNFSKERLLGQGAYGKVYRGVRDDGQEIAVKLLYDNMQTINDEQFLHEFHNLIMLKHPNIVRLVGYCYDTQRQHMDFQGRIVFGETTQKALCFEYMPKGSLQKHLSDECKGLDWQTRYKIIKGSCEGLKYLHKGLEKPFYHLDLKPDNILLDENMAPKLADFGLSKFYSEEPTKVTKGAVGTIGYMPHEYLFGNLVSNKLDIFSLGVVMIKIIAGPSGHTRRAEMHYQEFFDLVLGNWRKRLKEIWSSPEPLEAQCRQVKICTEIALSCMEIDRHKRPSIVDILHELNKTEIFIGKVTYYEQDPSLPLASTSNGVQPAASPPSQHLLHHVLQHHLP